MPMIKGIKCLRPPLSSAPKVSIFESFDNHRLKEDAIEPHDDCTRHYSGRQSKPLKTGTGMKPWRSLLPHTTMAATTTTILIIPTKETRPPK